MDKQTKPPAVKPIDVANGNVKALVDFVEGALGIVNTLKIELDTERRLNFLERSFSMAVHSLTPAIAAITELENKVAALEDRIVELEAIADPPETPFLDRIQADVERAYAENGPLAKSVQDIINNPTRDYSVDIPGEDA
jgi:hypothetical protein